MVIFVVGRLGKWAWEGGKGGMRGKGGGWTGGQAGGIGTEVIVTVKGQAEKQGEWGREENVGEHGGVFCTKMI